MKHVAAVLAVLLILPAVSAGQDTEIEEIMVRQRGRIFDPYNDTWVENARVVAGRVPNKESDRTDARGRYDVARTSYEGVYDPVRVRRPGGKGKQGYAPRKTWTQEASRRIEEDYTLIPRGKMFRHFVWIHRSRDREGTWRWIVIPRFILVNRELSCVPDTNCLELRAGDRAPLNFFRQVILEDVPIYSGGFISEEDIAFEVYRLRRGEVLDFRTFSGETNRIDDPSIVVTASDAGGRFYDGIAYRSLGALAGNVENGGIITSGRVDFNYLMNGYERHLVSHELAHLMGFEHDSDVRVELPPLPTIMYHGTFNVTSRDEDVGPQTGDVVTGRLLYDRSPGNTTPDKDVHPEIIEAWRAENNLASAAFSVTGLQSIHACGPRESHRLTLPAWQSEVAVPRLGILRLH